MAGAPTNPDAIAAPGRRAASELYSNRFYADSDQGRYSNYRRSKLGRSDCNHGILEYGQTRLVLMVY